MSAKLRSDSILSKLTEDQRSDLYDWCVELGYKQARDLAAKPAPEGFGLTIHKTTLVRFVADERDDRRAQRLAELAAGENTLSGSEVPRLRDQHSALSDLIRCARTEFAHATYELSLAASDPDNYANLERALHHIDTVANRQAHLKIQEQQLALERERFAFEKVQWQYNAARAALNYAGEFKGILNNTQTDNEEKIWEAREVCFGELPPDMLDIHQVSRGAGTHSSSSDSVTSVPSVVKDSPSEIHPSTFIPHPSKEDTLGHTETQSSMEPVPMESGLTPACPATAGLPPVKNPKSESVESVQSVVKTPEPVVVENEAQQPTNTFLPGRSMTGAEWFAKARDLNTVRQHILDEICKGDAEYLDFLIETGTKIIIHKQAVLRLVAA